MCKHSTRSGRGGFTLVELLAISRRRRRPRRRRGAFTLVELLVVIGIIAVLISVLLPALGKARQAAQTAACLSNLRTLGHAYVMYTSANRGWLPYAVYPSWDKYSTDPANFKPIHWYEAISPYLGQKIEYDPATGNRITDYAKVIRACPAWDLDQLGLANTPANDYLTGYGQNLTLFLGSGKAAEGSEKPLSAAPFGDPSYYHTGINNNNTGSHPETFAVGAVKAAKLPQSAKTILNGDSTNWFILVQQTGFPRAWTWWEPQNDPNLPRQLIYDSGAPTRHGGTPREAGGIEVAPSYKVTYIGKFQGSKPAKCRSNYLFLDGHAETLTSDVALRALATRNW